MRCSLPPLQCYEGTSAAGARSDSPLRFWMQQSSCERGRDPRVTPSGTSGVTFLAHESLPRHPRRQLGRVGRGFRGLRRTVTCAFSFRLWNCGLGCQLITQSSESASTVTRLGGTLPVETHLNKMSLTSGKLPSQREPGMRRLANGGPKGAAAGTPPVGPQGRQIGGPDSEGGGAAGGRPLSTRQGPDPRAAAGEIHGPIEYPLAPLSVSMLTYRSYYRTSRSLHFPFGAACSLSGSQPEIWSDSLSVGTHQ